MAQFISIEEPRRPAVPPSGFALWQLGFRPFYLLASSFAALSIALWAAQFAGWLSHPYLSGPLWHAHEMLFGFTLAVVVWVLHAAYAWIPLHLALRAASQWGWIGGTLATHALTVGAIGGLVIGMMTRTARGHTARALRADRFDVACYGLVLLAAVVRVGIPLAAPAWGPQAVVVSAALWSAGFGLYALRYWPVLNRPRLDGKAG